jgi:ribosome biogenesis GTPase A
MNQARRAIALAIPSKDVLLEVLDARMPNSSANPILTELRQDKPCVKILSKSDLADPEMTRAWIRHFESDASAGKVIAVALTRTRPAETRSRIGDLCRQLAPHRAHSNKGVRVMVVGIPNVGKSTLINTLMDRKVTKVGDEPAVTKGQQLVTMKDGMTLSDNPGILWPSIDPASTMRLALGGALPDTVIDYESVALFAAEFLLSRYPGALQAHFKLDAGLLSPPQVLEAIGRRRGCLRSGGVVEVHKAADILVHEFRAGRLGRISLENPRDERDERDAAEKPC